MDEMDESNKLFGSALGPFAMVSFLMIASSEDKSSTTVTKSFALVNSARQTLRPSEQVRKTLKLVRILIILIPFNDPTSLTEVKSTIKQISESGLDYGVHHMKELIF